MEVGLVWLVEVTTGVIVRLMGRDGMEEDVSAGLSVVI